MTGRRTRRRVLPLAVAALLLLLGAALAYRERPAPGVGGWLAAAGLSTREDVLAGRRVRHLRSGSGPAVVLIHGLASSIYTWQATIAPLSASHSVLALDLPGFGASEQPAELSFDDLVATIPALLDAEGIERASLVGNSLGGAVAAAVAARRPERVERLVLIDAAAFQELPGDVPAVVRLAVADPTGLLLRLPLRRPLTWLALRQVFHDDAQVTSERVEEYLAPMLRPGADASLRSLVHSPPAQLPRLRESLPRIAAPTLVVWGEEDRWIPLSHAERFREAIPGARVERIGGCGHMPQEECPEALLAAVAPFLAAPAEIQASR